MAEIIDTVLFPLGLITPTPGTPVDVLANFTALRDPSAVCNMILFQAHWTNTGRVYIGTSSTNSPFSVSGKTGILYTLFNPGDTFSVGSSAVNIFEVKKFLVDVQNLTDGVWVSVHVR